MIILFSNKYFTINLIKKIKSNNIISNAPGNDIDLGINYSCLGVWQNSKDNIIPTGERPTSSYVAFTETVRLVGDAVKN